MKAKELMTTSLEQLIKEGKLEVNNIKPVMKEKEGNSTGDIIKVIVEYIPTEQSLPKTDFRGRL